MTNTKRKPDALDALIGARIQLARNKGNFTRAQLGAAVAVSATQIWKYETGTSSLRAITLMRLAAALRKPITWFLQDVSESMKNGGPE